MLERQKNEDKGRGYHQTAQLSALRALALSFSDGSVFSFRLFAETFLEYVLQIFEADGAYLEFKSSSLEDFRIAIGSFGDEKAWRKILFPRPKKSALSLDPPASPKTMTSDRSNMDRETSSLVSRPIRWKHRGLGVLALWKADIPLFFKERDLEELDLFIHYIALASRKVSGNKKSRGETIREFSDNLEDGVYVIDRKAQAVMVNPKGKSLLGVHNDEEAIRALYDNPVLLNIRSGSGALLSPSELPLARILRGENFSSAEYLICRPGERREIRLSLSGGVLCNKKREVIEGVLIAREVPDYRR